MRAVIASPELEAVRCEHAVRLPDFFSGTPARLEVVLVGLTSELLLSRALLEVEAAMLLHMNSRKLGFGRNVRNGWKAVSN